MRTRLSRAFHVSAVPRLHAARTPHTALTCPGFIAFSVEVSGEFGIKMTPENKKCFHFADVLLSCCVLLCGRRPSAPPRAAAPRC